MSYVTSFYFFRENRQNRDFNKKIHNFGTSESSTHGFQADSDWGTPFSKFQICICLLPS